MAAPRSNKPYERPANSNDRWVHDKFGPSGNPTTKERTPTGPRTTAPSNAILVSNLHYEITPKDLTAIFGQIGVLSKDPHIRYDRSGRSSGTAIITFETPAEAIRAKRQFDGILAKDQPMTIVFDSGPPPTSRNRAANGPSSSLLNRIEKPSLVDRLSSDEVPSRGPGPTRNAKRGGKNTAPSGKPARVPKKPKTAADLDKELDTFMGTETAVQTPAADVDMV